MKWLRGWRNQRRPSASLSLIRVSITLLKFALSQQFFRRQIATRLAQSRFAIQIINVLHSNSSNQSEYSMLLGGSSYSSSAEAKSPLGTTDQPYLANRKSIICLFPLPSATCRGVAFCMLIGSIPSSHIGTSYSSSYWRQKSKLNPLNSS